MMNLKNRNVLISGGTSGIGLAFAKMAASKGANLAVFSVDPEPMRDKALEEIRQAMASSSQKAIAFELDVSNRDLVSEKLTSAMDEIGDPYVLINSAGMGGAVPFEEMPYERFDATVRINLYGTYHCILAALPRMKQGGGYICNVSSMSGLIGLFGYTAYASSKFALVGFSESLRAEMKKYDIMVSCLCPPQVDTPLLKKTDPTKPPETKALNNNAGLLTAEYVAKVTLEDMTKGRFLIVPGFRGKFFHLFSKTFPGVREILTDRVIRKVQQSRKATTA